MINSKQDMAEKISIDEVYGIDGDLPVLPDIDSIDIEARHEEEQQRKQDTLRWLEEHCDWKPFGGEW